MTEHILFGIAAAAHLSVVAFTMHFLFRCGGGALPPLFHIFARSRGRPLKIVEAQPEGRDCGNGARAAMQPSSPGANRRRRGRSASFLSLRAQAGLSGDLERASGATTRANRNEFTC